MSGQHGYPRPQLVRPSWLNLNGEWEFAIDAEAQWQMPHEVNFDRKIQVPFAPETPASGIHDTGFYRSVWYRRVVEDLNLEPGERLILHFGAVDYAASVWINGSLAAQHEGGYTPFSVDITEFLIPARVQSIVVRAEDDPADLAKPRGKQDWQLNPHSIWYPRTTGIWQTVWMERVSSTYICYLRSTPSMERWDIGLEVRLGGDRREDMQLAVSVHFGDVLLAQDTYRVVLGEVHRRIAFTDPGIDDFRNGMLWSPQHPNLIQLRLKLMGPDGKVVDEVQSYTALRSVIVQGDRITVNGRPMALRFVLDQGYWLDTGLTAPDDEALRKDVELAKLMGFNGVRKHQKIEDPRFLFWADSLGLLVWEEMPSAYRYTRASVDRLTREWLQVLERDISHPCIVAWVPFNESWGVPDLPQSQAQRHYVRALYHLTKTLDPSRPVIGNDGWESVATDIIGIHDYDKDPERISRRYGTDEVLPRLFKRERPGGRILLLDEEGHTGQPIMLTEFGGIAFSRNVKETWGYSRSHTQEDFADKVMELLSVVRSLPLLAGFCYTQFTDTYQEANGLLYADRTPKIPFQDIAVALGATSGNELEEQADWVWRERLMNQQRQQYVVPDQDYQVREGD
jgi:hypothetical protein